MQKLIPLKFSSLLLLVLMMTVTISTVHESAHAMQSHVSATGDQTSTSDISESHQCPCFPLEQHNDYDGCDTCVNCACHAPLMGQQLTLRYDPSFILSLKALDPFKYLPEVFLFKFIPPQNLA